MSTTKERVDVVVYLPRNPDGSLDKGYTWVLNPGSTPMTDNRKKFIRNATSAIANKIAQHGGSGPIYLSYNVETRRFTISLTEYNFSGVNTLAKNQMALGKKQIESVTLPSHIEASDDYLIELIINQL